MEIQNFQVEQSNKVSENYNADNDREHTPKNPPTKIEIQNWLVSYLAELLLLDTNDIDLRTPFDRYGLDSAAAVGLTGDLEDWLETELDPILIYDYPSVEDLSWHLSEQFKRKD